MYYQADETGRILATTEHEEYAGDDYAQFDFPEGFDFSTQNEYRISDGELVHDPVPVPTEQRIAELKSSLAATDYIAAKAMDAVLRGTISGTAGKADALASLAAEYTDVLDQRQAWRDEINELERG